MFWADDIAEKLKVKGLQHVDDMKTPSGKIHVGALRGVIIHDAVYRALKQKGVEASYTYVFEDHDPMDALPIYLPREKFEKYLGMPLYKVPSPVSGFENYAKYYALDFKKTFNALGADPGVIWVTNLYLSGKMNKGIKTCLDKAEIIRRIYQELYKKKMPDNWYPFQVYCPSCGKVSTTSVHDWDGEKVYFVCEENKVDWTKGCGEKSKVSPFSDKNGISGKLPWKIEWAVKWQVIGVTIEGGGKDHMSRGGSHDFAKLICQRVLDYPVPCAIAYEHFLFRGKKMSSSKGIGSSASEMLEMLPGEILRFLMVKTRLNEAIDFDPGKDTIPKLFDEYQEYAQAYFDNRQDDYARIFELSQVGKGVKQPPKVRFSTLSQWVQMPNMEEKIKEEGLGQWAKYANIWIEKYAPDSERFSVAKDLPKEIKNLSKEQKKLLAKISEELDRDWSAEDFQTSLYNWAKEIGISSKEAFVAIYLSLLGKDHGPRASWIILSLDRSFVRERFKQVVGELV